MAPFIVDEVAKRRPWTDEKTVLNNFALAQSLPGIIAINTATLIGYKLRKFRGAVAGFLGMVMPALLSIILIAGIYQSLEGNRYVEGALYGMRIAVLGLLVSSTWGLLKKSITDATGFALALTAFVALAFIQIPAVLVIFGGMFLSILIYHRKEKADGSAH